MAQNTNRPLKAYVRFDGTGRIVPSSLILRRKKPKVGKWVEIPAYECCNYTTTTSTTIACVETYWEYNITQAIIDNATGNTGIVITVNGESYTTENQTSQDTYIACDSSGGGGGNMIVQTVTLCASEEPYAWYYKDNAAVFIPVVNTLTPC